MTQPPDPATLSVFHALLTSVAEEMGVTLGRTAFSPNIKERRDYSCALFDPAGRLVAQAAHIPVHLGAMPTAVEAALPLAPFAPGDVVVLNDPYLGGTHLPDVTMVSPVFAAGRLAGYVATRAHHADIGGMAPGSMPVATELYQEGLIIPPVRLVRAGEVQRDVLALILRNVRTPEERRGDLDAQLAAHRTGEERLRQLVERYGASTVEAQMAALMDYAERMTREALRAIPPGEYRFEDAMDGTDDPVPIRVRLTVADGALHCDFTGSAPEQPGSINAVAAVTRSAVYYVVRCLLEPEVPTNHGCLRPVSFTLPEGTIVNARPPRAVSAGNVETSQRIVDVVLGALARALPDRIPAASAGTMTNVTVGGHDPFRDRPFSYYETIGGGAGGGPRRPGEPAVQTHMTNTMNTPVEALEAAYPMRVLEYAVRRGSGGPGAHPGGDGTVRTYEFLSEATVHVIAERRRTRPWGLQGGGPGAPGAARLERAGAPPEELPGHV
ncbi:MAG TPA: hydantoinase B/oxoprolinase family protein, partial [Dehalococcoidia bacterium]